MFALSPLSGSLTKNELSMHMNLFEDMGARCRDELIKAGYVVDPANDAHENMLSYFTVQRRVIPAMPRSVHVANGFVCPPDLQAGFDLVCQKAAAGAPLRPHQSKLLARTDYSDALLNDWDLHHFHLGTKIEANGWATRTGPLLFARVTESDFYCVAIVPHGDWYQQVLVQTIHDNWPDSIAHARMEGVVGLSHVPTDADVKTLRGVYINTFLQMPDGTVYGAPGGGCSTDGTSTRAVMAKINWVHEARRIEKQVKERLKGDLGAAICTALGVTQVPEDKLEFRFVIDHVAMPTWWKAPAARASLSGKLDCRQSRRKRRVFRCRKGDPHPGPAVPLSGNVGLGWLGETEARARARRRVQCSRSIP